VLSEHPLRQKHRPSERQLHQARSVPRDSARNPVRLQPLVLHRGLHPHLELRRHLSLPSGLQVPLLQLSELRPPLQHLGQRPNRNRLSAPRAHRSLLSDNQDSAPHLLLETAHSVLLPSASLPQPRPLDRLLPLHQPSERHLRLQLSGRLLRLQRLVKPSKPPPPRQLSVRPVRLQRLELHPSHRHSDPHQSRRQALVLRSVNPVSVSQLSQLLLEVSGSQHHHQPLDSQQQPQP
jgi:hypothetical protein